MADVRQGSDFRSQITFVALMPTKFTPTWALVLFSADLVMFALSVYVGSSPTGQRLPHPATRFSMVDSQVVLVVVWLLGFYGLGMYRTSLAFTPRDEIYFSAIAVAFGLIPMLLFKILLPLWNMSATALLLSAAIATALVGGMRTILKSLHHVSFVTKDAAQPPSIKPFTISRPSARLAKRLFDILAAALLLALCLPILLIACAVILAESGWPVLFRQERIGLYGRPFCMFKLRTMVQNSGREWAKPGDARITKFGSILRRTSIDELPQLLNVLRGEMSLVGPRPEMSTFETEFVATVANYAKRREALPGITGWAQVNVQRVLTPADIERVLCNDLFYIDYWSLFLDSMIILKTASEFLFHKAV